MSTDSRPLRVLVVDDNHDNADSLAMLLRVAGCPVLVAYDGEAALKTAEAERPSVMMVDLAMPRMNGIDLAKQVRLLPGLSSVLLIAMSGFQDDEHRDLARSAGFDHYLIKPMDPAKLVSLLGPRPRAPKE